MRHLVHAVVIVGLAGAGLVACGGSDEGQVPRSDARELLRELDEVDRLVADENCTAAQDHAGEVQAKVEGLPASVDRELREALRAGANQLVDLTAPPDCAADGEEPTETVPVEPPPPPEPPVETAPSDDDDDEERPGRGPDRDGPPGQQPPSDDDAQLDDGSGGASPPEDD